MPTTNSPMNFDNINTELSHNEWNKFVQNEIKRAATLYGTNAEMQGVLYKWHESITLGYKYDKYFNPHVNGFYMIFMVHGPWYESYLNYVKSSNEAGLSLPPGSDAITDSNNEKTTINLMNDTSRPYYSMMATDIDVPDITQEYISVSSRIRNSFAPSRNYFISDFSVSYIENHNLDITRYHEAWHKYMRLLKRGEIADTYTGGPNPTGSPQSMKSVSSDCEAANSGYFLEMPFSNAIWVVVFRPFTTDIQMIAKLMGVLPVNLPLKQVIGNRSQTKMTVLNLNYKAVDIFYKTYNSTKELFNDKGVLAKSFQQEIVRDFE